MSSSADPEATNGGRASFRPPKKPQKIVSSLWSRPALLIKVEISRKVVQEAIVVIEASQQRAELKRRKSQRSPKTKEEVKRAKRLRR